MVRRRGGTWHILVGGKQGRGAELSQQLQAQIGGPRGRTTMVRGLGGTLSMIGGRGQASSVEGSRRRALALERGM